VARDETMRQARGCETLLIVGSSPEEGLSLVRLIIGHRQGETQRHAALSMRRLSFVVAVGVAISWYTAIRPRCRRR